ncbi:hypothetical protein PspMM1_19710 [Pseudoalteromonas sp. MM1]|jgi:glutaredoxin 2|uniref:hypothetical protein n=1 Tax=Pseudoalteromonas sp. MM1 TaxID=3036714 RepID=UPI00257318A6|nr:hypothetical protein [Pseudoalteromonas sp. MM1]BED89503.1 hypothetical protein PspMM1_19710 [Pseudoalteromonas sp. MM1]
MKLYSYSHCPFCARVKYVAGKTSLSLLDSAIYYSILRGLYCEPTITWPEQLNQWMHNQALESGVPLVK